MNKIFLFMLVFLTQTSFSIAEERPWDTEIFLSGTTALTWTPQAEKSLNTQHIRLPQRHELETILSDPEAQKTEIKYLEHLLQGARQQKKVVRFRGLDDVRSEEHVLNLEQWEHFETFSPCGKNSGPHPWNAMMIRGMPIDPICKGHCYSEKYDRIGRSPIYLEESQIDDLLKLEFNLFDSFFTRPVASTSLCTPHKFDIFLDRNGVILNIPARNILCAANFDLRTPAPIDCLNPGGYIKDEQAPKEFQLYRSLRFLQTPAQVAQTYSYFDCSWNEVCVEPYNVDTQTAVSIEGLYVSENERNPQNWSQSSQNYYQFAREKNIPLMRFTQNYNA